MKRSEKLIPTSKQLAVSQQICAAIEHFRKDEFECAITLAAAAEGLLPPTEHPHMFTILKDNPAFEPSGGCNSFVNWLKHPVKLDMFSVPELIDTILIPEFEVVMIIMRAISKFLAVYRTGSREMKVFTRWAFARGHLLTVPGSAP